MILIIAEKPSVMKNIIEASLDGVKARISKGCAFGKDIIYTHCIGHLLTLAMPGQVDSKYRYWNINTLPFRFDNIPLVVNEGVKSQLDIVLNLINRDDITEIVNACDSDREGDLIFRNLFFYSKSRVKEVSRMWIESQTVEGIRESFSKRLHEKEYNNVYFAGKSRSYADYIIGLNSTMAMTSRFGSHENVLTIGRVQTPTLRIIVDVEKEIRDFKPKKYYKITANGLINDEDIVGNYLNKELEGNRFLNKDDALKTIDKIGLGQALVTECDTVKRFEKPKMLYSLSDLQVDMDKRYGMSPIDVLNTVQALYETHKLVTYPRTDENHISEALASEGLSIISGLNVNKNIRDTIVNNHYTINSIMIAKKELGAHEALTPTKMKVTDEMINKLNSIEMKVYMAIVERFMASFFPDAVIEKQKVVFIKNDESFQSEFEIVTNEGHRACYVFDKKKGEKEKKFLSAKKGDYVDILKLNLNEGETTPPTRFTEGTLVKMMKNPVKYVSSKDDKAVLKRIEGIGTEATRANIIVELKKRGLIEVDKNKYIHPTEKGIDLIDIIPSELIKSVSLTASFERKLDLISRGKYDYKEFLNEINDMEAEFIKDVKGIDLNILNLKKQSITTCPICSGYIIEKEMGYFCSTKNCKVGIFKTARGAKNITKEQAINLLTKGNSVSKVLCTSKKTGQDFESVMVYKYVDGDEYPNHLDFDFKLEGESLIKRKAICKCPICGDSIIEEDKYFGCQNKSCNVRIYKNVRGVVKLTKKALVELLTDGITSGRLKCIVDEDRTIEVYLSYKYLSGEKYPNKVEYVFEKNDEKRES